MSFRNSSNVSSSHRPEFFSNVGSVQLHTLTQTEADSVLVWAPRVTQFMQGASHIGCNFLQGVTVCSSVRVSSSWNIEFPVITLFFVFRVQPALLWCYPKSCRESLLVYLECLFSLFLQWPWCFWGCFSHALFTPFLIVVKASISVSHVHFSEAFPGWPLGKVQEFVVWNNESLTRKAKSSHASTNKEFIHYFPWAGWYSNTSRKAESSCIMVTWKDKCHHSEWRNIFLLLYPCFYCCTYLIWCGTTLWQIWASCPGSVPIQIHCTIFIGNPEHRRIYEENHPGQNQDKGVILRAFIFYCKSLPWKSSIQAMLIGVQFYYMSSLINIVSLFCSFLFHVAHFVGGKRWLLRRNDLLGEQLCVWISWIHYETSSLVLHYIWSQCCYWKSHCYSPTEFSVCFPHYNRYFHCVLFRLVNLF